MDRETRILSCIMQEPKAAQHQHQYLKVKSSRPHRQVDINHNRLIKPFPTLMRPAGRHNSAVDNARFPSARAAVHHHITGPGLLLLPHAFVDGGDAAAAPMLNRQGRVRVPDLRPRTTTTTTRRRPQPGVGRGGAREPLGWVR